MVKELDVLNKQDINQYYDNKQTLPGGKNFIQMTIVDFAKLKINDAITKVKQIVYKS